MYWTAVDILSWCILISLLSPSTSKCKMNLIQASKPLESQEIFRNAEKDIGTKMKTRSLVLFCTGLTTGFSAWCKCLRMRPRLLEVVGKAYSVTFREVGEQQRNEWNQPKRCGRKRVWKFRSTNGFWPIPAQLRRISQHQTSTSCWFPCQVDPPTWATRLISGWHKSVQVYEAPHCPRWWWLLFEGIFEEDNIRDFPNLPPPTLDGFESKWATSFEFFHGGEILQIQ